MLKNFKIKDSKLSGTNIILIFILIIATVLRLWRPFDIPYINDEFSALFRTRFASFAELIEKGVKVDGHPAGIQVFLFYWTKITGFSEFFVKLPFIIAGIVSVFFIFKVSQRWFNSTVGLVCSSYLATLEYGIYYSQIARPYASGLFFTLLMVYFWDKSVFNKGKHLKIYMIFFALSASLCTYNHHFSLFLAAIVSITGIFLIERKNLVLYLGSCLLIVLLYIPHLQVFFYQLKTGGVEGWLGKPQNDFILTYLNYLFHFSPVVIAIAVTLIIFGFLQKGATKKITRFTFISLSWFLVTFLIGFFYSIFVNSVLQFSVLIFSFPFLLFFIFGHIPEVSLKKKIAIVVVICSVNIFSLVKERHYYELFYKPAEKEMMILSDASVNKLGGNKCLSVVQIRKEIGDYYKSEFDLKNHYELFDRFASKKDFINFLNQNKESKYFIFGCLSGIDPEIVPIIIDHFPFIEEQQDFYNGSFYIFSKEKTKKSINFCTDYSSFFRKKDISAEWSSFNDSLWKNAVLLESRPSYFMDSTMEYGPTFTEELKKMVSSERTFVDISAEFLPVNSLKDLMIVSSLEIAGKQVDWRATEVSDFVVDSASGIWVKAHHTIKLSDLNVNYNDVVIKVFLWNRARQKFYVNDLNIRSCRGNKFIYGLSQKLD